MMVSLMLKRGVTGILKCIGIGSHGVYEGDRRLASGYGSFTPDNIRQIDSAMV